MRAKGGGGLCKKKKGRLLPAVWFLCVCVCVCRLPGRLLRNLLLFLLLRYFLRRCIS